MLSDQHCRIPVRLKFLNSCKNDKYSKHKIEADDKTPLKVAIYNHKDEIITSEPFSSMRVHIVPIQGDFDNDHKRQWNKEHFSSNIVSGRPGKVPLLSGDLYFRLQNGVGYLNTAKFEDNSSFVASKRFKLGVMAADERISQRIQEGITESFAVKDVRGYSTKKNVNPSPCDPVYKLRRIGKDGERRKLLEENGIKTVQDLIFSYNQSHEDLRKIFGKISDQDWDMIINHAKNCSPRPANHEHATIFSSDGSFYHQGSSSMQPSPAPQKQVDDQVMQKQSSSTYYELSSGVSLEDTPGEAEQVSGIGNEVLSVSAVDNNTSQQGPLSKYMTMLGGNAQPHVNSDPNIWDWTSLVDDPGWEGSCSALEQSGGLTPASDAGGRTPLSDAGGRTPTSEAGSCGSRMGYSRSPVRTARGTRGRRFSSSPARGASSSSYWARPPLPMLGAAETAFTEEEPRKMEDLDWILQLWDRQYWDNPVPTSDPEPNNLI